MNWSGFIPIIGGIYGYLLATGHFSKNPNEPEKMDLWREEYGGIVKILLVLVFVLGLVLLSGILQA